MQVINIYTDGACKGNPGPGGYAYIIELGSLVWRHACGELQTTNNRMELTALLQALRNLNTMDLDPKENYTINIYSDSKYVTDSFNKGWLYNWVRRDFINVKNTDLWQQVYTLITPLMLLQNITVNINWVKGHAGVALNEAVDELAQSACGQQGIILNHYYNAKTKNEKGQ